MDAGLLVLRVVVGLMLVGQGLQKLFGLWVVDIGYEYPLVISAVAVSLSFTGAGIISLDARFGISGISDAGVGAGVPATAMGLVAGTAVLLSRIVGRPAARDHRTIATRSSALIPISGGSL